MLLETKIAEKAPGLTNLRERFLTRKLAQVELALATRQDELQRSLNSTFGLSPAKIDQKQFELDALRDLKVNLLNGLETVARQSAVSAAEPADNDAEEWVGGYRTQRAFFENLQRERAKVAPLSRDQWDRAKELSAKRSRYSKRGVDLDSEQVVRSVHPTWFTNPGQVRSYMFAKKTLTGVDPCIEAKKVRRQVMFAQKSAGIGYRVKHEVVPC